MTRKLKNLVIDRVDLVDAGANFDPESGEGSFILLAKRAPVDDGDPELAAFILKKCDGDAALAAIEMQHLAAAKVGIEQRRREYGKYAGYSFHTDDLYGDEDYGPSYRRALAKVAKTADPEDQLEQLALAFREEYLPESDDQFYQDGPWTPEHKLADATEIVMRSPRGRELVAEIRAARAEKRATRSRTTAERLGRTYAEPDLSDRVVTEAAHALSKRDLRPSSEELTEARALLRRKQATGSWH